MVDDGYSVYKKLRTRENIGLDNEQTQRALSLLYGYWTSGLTKKVSRRKK